MKVIRTLMVDDSPEFLEATGGFLDIFPHIEVIGQIRKGAEVLEAVQTLTPDLILLDLSLPDIHGFEILQQLKKNKSVKAPVVVVTLFSNPEYRQKAEELGADGYILKGELTEEILPVIAGLFKGQQLQGITENE